ncbi:MAG: hypothetical protein U5R49_25795 [Deltaproteobacteria bacterium]|nr:hypothetical protein [Deltaproteobacteria bacterium]
MVEKRVVILDAVMNYLISKGISKDRLSAKGYGFTRPVSTHTTKVGHAPESACGADTDSIKPVFRRSGTIMKQGRTRSGPAFYLTFI